MQHHHEIFMTRCLELAKNGLGSTYPNPLVGCVIVYNEEIIGEGWHQEAGKPHAEVNAISAVQRQELLPLSTLYVNLEPCSHYGRTPPCADLIIEKKIKKVVIGSVDIHEKVKGSGIARLEKNGVEVVTGILESECGLLNKRFFTFHRLQRPYVILKWAQTADAYIFPEAEQKKGAPVWISNAYSQLRVHQWRSQEGSILVGKNTVLQDDPKLNTRNYKGSSPVRLVIDKGLDIPESRHIYDQQHETIIFNGLKEGLDRKVKFVKIDFAKGVIGQILGHLHDAALQSLIVEGGAYTLNEFIREGLWDEARVFYSDIRFEKGIKAPVLQSCFVKEEKIRNDRLCWYVNEP